jgi:hypothetical protein
MQNGFLFSNEELKSWQKCQSFSKSKSPPSKWRCIKNRSTGIAVHGKGFPEFRALQQGNFGPEGKDCQQGKGYGSQGTQHTLWQGM